MFVLLAVLMLTALPVAFNLGGLAVLFAAIGWFFGLFQFVEYYNLVARIWRASENLALIAIPCFIFMGMMLERSEIAKDLLHALQTLLRRVPGGLALSITLMSTVMAAITGIVGASVVMMTIIALPTMLRLGYHPAFATGTIAASSSLVILIPPSILLVFMSDMLGISEGVLFASALFPGLTLSALYLVYILGVSIMLPKLAPPTAGREVELPVSEMAQLCAKGIIPPVILIAMVLGSVFAGVTTITESAAIGVLGTVIIAGVRGRLTLSVFNDCLQRSALMIGMIFLLFGAAMCFSYTFRILGGDEIVTQLIGVGRLEGWEIMVVLMATIFLMGFFFDVLEIILVVVPVFAPIVGVLDFGSHVAKEDVIYWFSMLVAVNLQTSFLTPPMGIALFYMKSAAPKEVKMQQIYLGVIPFVVLQLICVGLVMGFPDLAMWLPHKLFDY
ncbi:MAG: C4-dicarboxylate ABC transporter [Rhodospirillaceae bacterium]|nr:C4-dicarboxylate ABC transporter [Rhodospirillaceae bacterium]